MFKRKINNGTVLIVIIVVATIFRFINYFEIPFTHDEFSTLFRLNFNSFSELIEKGVKVDTHPAGIQVFLYYWTKLFGYEEWIIKFPFTVFGILSVYLTYLIGKRWFNTTVGLLAAAYIASIQFTIVYSQIARPYISGMFFSLLMIHYWTNLMMNPSKGFYRNSLLFIVSTSLCAYNHHFSLLFAAIVGISGIFFIQRKLLVKYFISGIIIFILYVPHLEIFFSQLNMGGIEGWLAKPHNYFLLDFIYYSFNYSIVAIVLTLGIIFLGCFHFKKDTSHMKLIILSFAWFIIPFLVGFFYSRYVNAVLQFSVLIFSFPLLFFVLFGFIKKQNPKINLILVSAILLTNILTLIYGRKHYSIFYNSIYKEILADYENAKINNGNSRYIYIVDSDNKISDYYTSKLNIDTNFVNYPNSFKSLTEFKRFLEAEAVSNDKLFFGCLSSVSPLIIPLIQDYFPNIEVQNNYYGGTTYLFSKQIGTLNNIIDSISFNSSNAKKWSSIDSSRIIATNVSTQTNNTYFIGNKVEWGPAFTGTLSDIIKNENNFIDASVKVKTKDNLDQVLLVGSLESNGKNIYWSGTIFKDFILPQHNGSEWTTIHHSIKLSDIYLRYDSIILKVHIWNKGKKNFIIDDFNIYLREGNPIIYGLDQKI